MSSKIKRMHVRRQPKNGDRVVYCKHPDLSERTDFYIPGHTRSPRGRLRWLSACSLCVAKYGVPTAIPRGEVGDVEVAE